MNTSCDSFLYGINLLSIINLPLPSMVTSPSSWVASQNPFADASSAAPLSTIQHVNIHTHVPITLDYSDSPSPPGLPSSTPCSASSDCLIMSTAPWMCRTCSTTSIGYRSISPLLHVAQRRLATDLSVHCFMVLHFCYS
jgi:hypothetical protein